MSISKAEQDFISHFAKELRSCSSDQLRYFFLNPDAPGAGDYLKQHKKEVSQLLTQTLKYFYFFTIMPPESCDAVRWWEKQMDWFFTIREHFELEEIDHIREAALSAAYYGTVAWANDHPDRENQKKFFEVYPEFFGMVDANGQPTPDEVGDAVAKAASRWEESDLCETVSELRTLLRELRAEYRASSVGAESNAPESRAAA